MANITAKDVASLRERTGVGMMDCKKALVEAEGDVEKAIVILREKGLATQAKKAGRVAAEGIVASVVEGNVGVVVEVNSETDFVANTAQFKNFVDLVAKTIIEANPADVDALKACKASGSDKTVEEELQEVFLQIRENIQIRRFVRMEGTLVSYVHGEGRIGVMVKLDTDLGDKAYDCGKDCALQIAAMNPAYLDRNSVPADVIEGEKKVIMGQMAEDPKMANKPEAVLAKIAEGKLGKYYTENCLVDQEFVKDGEYTVGKYVEKCAKDLGGSIKVVDYVRFERGEGIAKKADNFADEVASMIK
jgi:translation elongation factor Ts